MAKSGKKHLSKYNLISTIAFVAIVLLILFLLRYVLPILKENDPKNKLEQDSVSHTITSSDAGDGDLNIHFISVGQADSIFIQFPNGYNMLVDAAEKSSVNKVISYISDLGVDTLDYVLLTHQDADHCGGMADIFDRFVVKNALRPSVYSTYKNYSLPELFNVGTTSQSLGSSTATYYNYLNAIYNEEGCQWEVFNKDSDISFVYTATSEATVSAERQAEYDSTSIDSGNGAEMQNQIEYECFVDFLSPTAEVGDIKYKQANNFSPIMMITYCGVKIMLTGDAEKEVEEEVLDFYKNRDLDVDILKVGHHGSKTSSTSGFISAVKPEIAVISCGLDPSKNKFCPWQVTLDTLTNIGAAIYRTDIHGNIILTVSSDSKYSINTDNTCDDYSLVLTGYSN